MAQLDSAHQIINQRALIKNVCLAISNRHPDFPPQDVLEMAIGALAALAIGACNTDERTRFSWVDSIAQEVDDGMIFLRGNP